MEARIRKAIYAVILAVLVPLCLFLLYSYHVITLLRSTSLTQACNASDSNVVRESLSSYAYGLNPSNWGNLSNYMNSICLSWETQNNSIWGGFGSRRPNLTNN